jgi:hypothetical protein
MLDELIFFMLMAVGVTYLDDGGPYAGNYSCPAYCAVNHKHLAFKDTLVVISDMAKNNNKSMLGGFLNYMSGRLGTEIDSLPSGERSLDNLKEMSSFMDTYQDAKQAQAVAVADMRNEGMDVDILPRSDLAFKQAEPDKTKVDMLVKEADFNVNEPSFDFEGLLSREGGDKLHRDSGGLTKFGITTAWGLNENQIKNLTKDEALNLYKDKYSHWASSWQGDGGSQKVGDKMFDVSVNMGRSGANKVMQNTLTKLGYSTQIDGGWVAGGETDTNYKKAIADLGENAVLEALIDEQKRHYSDIIKSDPKKYGQYARGWENRANFMQNR